MRTLVGIASATLALATVSSHASEPSRVTAVPLVRLAPAHVARCERSGLLRPVCPRRVPRAREHGSSLYVEPALDVFDLGYGAEAWPPQRNRPPRLLHAVAIAGDVERFTPYLDPTRRSSRTVRDGLLARERVRPLSFGRVRWGERSGVLYLAPPYGYGGQNGNHVVFSWRERRRSYALSLHAWEPLREAAHTLRRMVEALPTIARSRRIAELTTVSSLSIGRGQRSRTVVAGAPGGIHAFDVRVVARARTVLELAIEPPTGDRIPVLPASARGTCSVRVPYRLCFVRFRAVGPMGAGRWRIVVTKRSEPPAQVRVDLLFREG